MIHEFTIANGLKVIGIESHKSPVVSVQMWVRNGSADERDGDEGLSHFIEHLVFKGSRKYEVGEIAAMVESCGGELNAYTSFDQTVFYVTLSKNFFGKALEVVSEMVGYPQFNHEEIDKEREVVIEEIKRSADSLSRCASRLMFSTMYKDYPYSVPVIGYEDNIRTVSHERIKSFFHERYVPKNMFLVVTGDFDPKTLEKDVTQYFGDMEDRPVEIPKRTIVPKQIGRRTEVEKAPFEESLFYLAWPTFGVAHKDLPALEALSLIFGQGGSSRLTMELRLKNPSVNYVGAGTWSPKTRGFLAVTGALNPDKYEEALSGVKSEIEKLFKYGVSEDELLKAKTNFLSDEAYSMETVGGLARKYGSNFDLTEDINLHEKFYKGLESVSCDDLNRVARTYIRPELTNAIALVPSNEEEIKKLLEEWDFDNGESQEVISKEPVKGPRFKAGSSAKGEADITTKEHQLSSGARVLMRENKSSPVFHMRMATLSGSRVLDSNQAGLTELLSRTWAIQTQKTDEHAFRKSMDSLASSVYAFSGRNTIGLVVDGLTDYQKPLDGLFSEVFLDRKFTAETMDRERNMIYESLRSRKDNPAQIASLMFQKNLFGNHPYGLDSMGNEKTLAALTEGNLESYLATYLSPSNMVFSMSGDFDEAMWLDKLEAYTSQLSQDSLQIDHKIHKDLEKDIYVFEQIEKEQTNIIYGFKGLSLTDPDRFTLQVIESILAGQGGRLFMELRDKASLAYSVSPLRLEGLETGYFAAYIGCSPEKSKTAIDMMKVEFDKLMNDKVSVDEIDRAKNYLLGHHDIHLQKNSAIASAMLFNEVYGVSLEEVFDYQKYLKDITADDIQRVSQRVLSQKHVISAAGPENFLE